MKRSNQLRAHKTHLNKLLKRHCITTQRARDIIWTSERIDKLQDDIDMGFDEWVKDDWPHAPAREYPRSGYKDLWVSQLKCILTS